MRKIDRVDWAAAVKCAAFCVFACAVSIGLLHFAGMHHARALECGSILNHLATLLLAAASILWTAFAVYYCEEEWGVFSLFEKITDLLLNKKH